jgi:hypothetical protein
VRPPPTVTVERSAIADIGYGLLAAVDLGRDAANLYAPRREFDRLALAPAPAWAAALQAALRAHPRDALVLQAGRCGHRRSPIWPPRRSRRRF